MMAPEDRPIVAMMATQIYCARVQAGNKVDVVLVAGEATALLTAVDRHLSPRAHRKAPVPSSAPDSGVA